MNITKRPVKTTIHEVVAVRNNTYFTACGAGFPVEDYVPDEGEVTCKGCLGRRV